MWRWKITKKCLFTGLISRIYFVEIHWISSQVGLYSVLSRDPPEDICGDKKNAKMFTHRWVYTRCCGQSAKILKEHLQSVKVDFYLVSKVYFFICLAKYTFICLEKYISIHLSLYLHHSLSSQKKKILLIHFHSQYVKE